MIKYKLVSFRKTLFYGDVFIILFLLLTSYAICIVSNLIDLLFRDCMTPVFIMIFSDTSMSVWNLLLIYSIFHDCCYNTNLSKKNWIICFFLGFVTTMLFAYLGFILSNIDYDNSNNYCIISPVEWYLGIIFLLQIVLFIINVFLFFNAESDIK
jgi:hypothetical protein